MIISIAIAIEASTLIAIEILTVTSIGMSIAMSKAILMSSKI